MIRLVFEEEELERVFAIRRAVEEDLTPVSGGADQPASSADPTQPQAVAEDFVLTGDSIEADLAGGELERVTATGSARGVSTARDSLNTDTTDELIRSDWIEGDTIIATFRSVSVDPATPPRTDRRPPSRRGGKSTCSSPVVRRIASTGRPRVGDREWDRRTSGARAQLRHRRRGASLHEDGEVERMEVDNPTGVYLQPRRAPAPPADSVPPGGNGGSRE